MAAAAGIALSVAASACACPPPDHLRPPPDERFVFFAANGADVAGVDGFFSLGYVAAYLDASPRLHILIVGHADGRGTVEVNRALSFRRANAVRAALVGHGVAVERIDIGVPVEEARSLADSVSRRADLHVYDAAVAPSERRLPKGVEVRRE